MNEDSTAANLQAKVARLFGPYWVNKRMAREAGFGQLPAVVIEHLLAKARVDNPGLGLCEVQERVKPLVLSSASADAFKAKLMVAGTSILLAELRVEPLPKDAAFRGRIELLGEDIVVDEKHVVDWPDLLDGLWGACKLRYEVDGGGKKPQGVFVLEAFSPFQATQPNLDAFRRARAEFGFDEWIDFVIRSAGYNPSAFQDLRHKLLLLARLVPLAERNVNLLELGPKGTGKTFLLRNLSQRVSVLAGSKTTAKQLFVGPAAGKLGLLARKKVVVFDEITSTTYPRDLVPPLGDYMESGTIAAGGGFVTGECSLYMAGNVPLAGDGRGPSSRYVFKGLPDSLRNTAFGDRLHGIIPGWDLPKITPAVLADGVGMLSGYLGGVLVGLRDDPWFENHLKTNCHLQAVGSDLTPRDVTQRDQNAIYRIAGGLLKILFPHREVDENVLPAVLEVAVALRQRVCNQLAEIDPGEFPSKEILFPNMPPHPDVDFRPPVLAGLDKRANSEWLVGEVTMLVVSDAGGGDVCFAQCHHLVGSGVSVLGLTGEVLRISAKAAYHALLQQGQAFGLGPMKLKAKEMSVFLVEIAKPKDGPSAGLAFALGMLSAATGRKVRPALAVTGEIAPSGFVGAIGGLPEKLQAAKQHGRRVVIIPKANADELPGLKHLTSGLEVRPVETLAEAITIALEPGATT
jgi:ATP-dependent Lon protease